MTCINKFLLELFEYQMKFPNREAPDACYVSPQFANLLLQEVQMSLPSSYMTRPDEPIKIHNVEIIPVVTVLPGSFIFKKKAMSPEELGQMYGHTKGETFMPVITNPEVDKQWEQVREPVARGPRKRRKKSRTGNRSWRKAAILSLDSVA